MKKKLSKRADKEWMTVYRQHLEVLGADALETEELLAQEGAEIPDDGTLPNIAARDDLKALRADARRVREDTEQKKPWQSRQEWLALYLHHLGVQGANGLEVKILMAQVDAVQFAMFPADAAHEDLTELRNAQSKSKRKLETVNVTKEARILNEKTEAVVQGHLIYVQNAVNQLRQVLHAYNTESFDFELKVIETATSSIHMKVGRYREDGK